MKFNIKLYDCEGNEIDVKDGDSIVMGLNKMAKVSIDTYEVKMVYKDEEIDRERVKDYCLDAYVLTLKKFKEK